MCVCVCVCVSCVHVCVNEEKERKNEITNNKVHSQVVVVAMVQAL